MFLIVIFGKMLRLTQHINNLTGHDTYISFDGVVDVEVINTTLQTIEEKLSDKALPKRIKRKVYNILVEALQNIFHHRMENETLDYQRSIFSVTEHDNKFHIYTGNYLEKAAVDVVKSKIDNVNKLTKEQVVIKYREILDDGIVTDKGGSGLGFLDMFRKSKNILGYKFYNEETYTFFVLHITLNVNK